jgi:hypothetical protein
MWDYIVWFTDNWYFIGTMIFLLLVLVAVLVWRLVLTKKEDD